MHAHCYSNLPMSEHGNGSALAVLLLVLAAATAGAAAYGGLSPVAASFEDNGDAETATFCAVDAGGKQQIMCWLRNGTSPLSDEASAPSVAALAGGRAFMCALTVADMRPLCWLTTAAATATFGPNLVPPKFRIRRYSAIAAGDAHVCALRTSFADQDELPGALDCWAVNATDPALALPPGGGAGAGNTLFKSVVAGSGFICALNDAGAAVCWATGAPLSFNITAPADRLFLSIVSGAAHVCGIVKSTLRAYCWGDNSAKQAEPPASTRFMALSAGAAHACGIRQHDHGVECWGDFNESAIPRSTGFLSLASSDNVTCGVREDNLLLDCWGRGSDFSPPLQLCSPGLCRREACAGGEFLFNISALGLPDVSTPCWRREQQICSACADACPPGTFLSEHCSAGGDRLCTDCSLCQNTSCSATCAQLRQTDSAAAAAAGVQSKEHHRHRNRYSFVAILGLSVVGGFLLALMACLVPWFLKSKAQKPSWCCCCSCGRKPHADSGSGGNGHPLQALSSSSGAGAVAGGPTAPPWLSMPEFVPMMMQAFRYTELRDATNGFKELNELGRGSYGFVYRALLSDGRQVAVKRANAVRRIQSNSRDFEAEIEVICKVHHGNLVNLLGYCEEMGERLLVYEFMPHGTLHDHLHGGLSPLPWQLRLRISMQAARGIEYLHRDASPPLIHKDIKASNILLDADWTARVADFGLNPCADRADSVYTDPEFFKLRAFTDKSDVYSFGVVLLEILSARKAYDTDFSPPNIVEWAVPLISHGRAVSILDRGVELPKNVEPLLVRMAEIAEVSVRRDPKERPSISKVASWLEQLVRSCS